MCKKDIVIIHCNHTTFMQNNNWMSYRIMIYIIIFLAFAVTLQLDDDLISLFAYSITQNDLEEIRENLMEVRLSLQKGDLIEALQHLNNADEDLLLIQSNLSENSFLMNNNITTINNR